MTRSPRATPGSTFLGKFRHAAQNVLAATALVFGVAGCSPEDGAPGTEGKSKCFEPNTTNGHGGDVLDFSDCLDTNTSTGTTGDLDPGEPADPTTTMGSTNTSSNTVTGSTATGSTTMMDTDSDDTVTSDSDHETSNGTTGYDTDSTTSDSTCGDDGSCDTASKEG